MPAKKSETEASSNTETGENTGTPEVKETRLEPEDRISELEKNLHEKDLLIADLENKIKYLIADFENFKKFTSKEKELIIKFAAEDLIKQLLPIIDSLENATKQSVSENIVSLLDGIKIVSSQLMELLGKYGLTPIKAAGEKFDPYKHEAVMLVEDKNKEDGIVLEELEKGYMLGDKVIRTSKVKVNKWIETDAEKQTEEVKDYGKNNRH